MNKVEIPVVIQRVTLVPIDMILKTEESRRRFVPSSETWVAFDRPQNVQWVLADIEINDITRKACGYIKDDDLYIVSVSGLNYNDILYTSLCTTKFKVPTSVTIGHFDCVYRQKYIIVPNHGYWDVSGYPLVITKGKLT